MAEGSFEDTGGEVVLMKGREERVVRGDESGIANSASLAQLPRDRAPQQARRDRKRRLIENNVLVSLPACHQQRSADDQHGPGRAP
jgi:hypothetical protein